MKAKRLEFPLKDREELFELRAGDLVLVSGVLLAARDATHRRLLELTEKGEVSLLNQAIYYVGPTPAPPGRPVGSAGPTTSYRMDPYTPALLKAGLAATIGKGPRGEEVKKALREFKAVYLATFGGAGVYLSERIVRVRTLAFEELGPEALFELSVRDFPAVVINDLYGGDYYEEVLRNARSIRRG